MLLRLQMHVIASAAIHMLRMVVELLTHVHMAGTLRLHFSCVARGRPGLLPLASARLLMMGMKMPPARAVVLGIAGATSASATLRPYARPRVLFPKARTNSVATRSPRPVFSKPCSHAACMACGARSGDNGSAEVAAPSCPLTLGSDF